MIAESSSPSVTSLPRSLPEVSTVPGEGQNADPTPFRKISRGTPKKIMEQLGGTGMLETEHLASLWIDPRHHMPDRTIFSSRVHRLKDQQNGIAVGYVMKLLQCA